VIGKFAISSGEECRCTNDLALFPVVNCRCGSCETRGTSGPDFDESQAFSIEHDQVDLATSTTKISSDRAQTPAFEIVEGPLLGAVA